MRWVERAILTAGLLTMAALLWKFQPQLVWAEVSAVGWGFALILPFQLFDQALNALGWRFAFCAEDAGRIPFRRLVLARVAGDGVNYLTPSATIAGELIRPAMLGDLSSPHVRNASVVVAKFAQALGQALFVLLGVLCLLSGPLAALGGRFRAAAAGGAVLVMCLIGTALYVVAGRPGTGLLRRFGERLADLRGQVRLYLSRHPGRFVLSTVFFSAGFAWGALEVLLICRFMGIPISLQAALAVETLSNIIESLMFMVPAKLGTQEGGKTAIFHALGYPAAQGLAFGLIRHTRELFWACLGFGLYAWNRRASRTGGEGRRARGDHALAA